MADGQINLDDLLTGQTSRVRKLVQSAYWMGARDFGPIAQEHSGTVEILVEEDFTPNELPMLLRR